LPDWLAEADTELLAWALAQEAASGQEADNMGWLYGGIAVVVVAMLLVGLLVDRRARQQRHPVQMNRARLRSLRFRHARGDLGMEDNPTGVRSKPAGIEDVGMEAARRSPRIPPQP
jgi:hypothetical protein